MQPRQSVSVNHRLAFTGEFRPRIFFGGGENVNPPDDLANTYGAWGEYTDATLEDWDGFDLHAHCYTGGAGRRCMFEIGVGAAGSEVVIAGPFLMGINLGYHNTIGSFFIPRMIPRGSRIAIRWQVSTAWPASERPDIKISLVGRRRTESLVSGAHFAVYGADAANTAGTITFPNTYGDFAWREIVASAPFHVRHLTFSYGASAFGFVNHRVFELGVGAAASELGIVQRGVNALNAGFSLAVDIPTGSRIAFRYAQFTNEGATGYGIFQLFG